MTSRAGGEERRGESEEGAGGAERIECCFFCNHVGLRDRSVLSRTDTPHFLLVGSSSCGRRGGGSRKNWGRPKER
jgi:hypothetical protein